MAIPQGTINAGWVTCKNVRLPKNKGVGQHAGILNKIQKTIGLGVGQHEQEWWVIY